MNDPQIKRHLDKAQHARAMMFRLMFTEPPRHKMQGRTARRGNYWRNQFNKSTRRILK